MSVAILERAQGACQKPIVYKLGKGGFTPAAQSPGEAASQCDCSGFVAWCIGQSRQTSNPFYKALNGGWIETTAMVADALAVGGIFTKTDNPVPGDVIVWGDRKVNGKTVQGHVGIIAQVADGKATKVIHCSSGNFKKFGKAIQETDAALFYRNNAICARFVGTGG